MITLKQPANGAKFTSGSSISGTAKVSQVWYRLVDNQAGQIGQGPISVVNGKFNAAVKFGASSSSGHLDIFTYNGGAEANELSIDLNF